MSKYYQNCYELQKKLDEVKTLIEEAIDPNKTFTMAASLDRLYKALEVINEC